MKIISMVVLLFAYTAISTAQGVFSNTTNATLSKVIEDYPNSFKNIRGELIVHDARSADFKSKIELPGSLYCNIKQYVNSHKELYSWNCIAYRSKAFRLSSAKFSQLYRQISNTIINIDGMSPFILNAVFEEPAEDRTMTTISFQPVPAAGELKKLKIVLSLLKENSDWKVYLSVYGDDPGSDITVAGNQ